MKIIVLKVGIALTMVCTLLLSLYFLYYEKNYYFSIFNLGGMLFLSVTYKTPKLLLVTSPEQIDEFVPKISKNINFWISLVLMFGSWFFYFIL